MHRTVHSWEDLHLLFVFDQSIMIASSKIDQWLSRPFEIRYYHLYLCQHLVWNFRIEACCWYSLTESCASGITQCYSDLRPDAAGLSRQESERRGRSLMGQLMFVSCKMPSFSLFLLDKFWRYWRSDLEPIEERQLTTIISQVLVWIDLRSFDWCWSRSGKGKPSIGILSIGW